MKQGRRMSPKKSFTVLTCWDGKKGGGATGLKIVDVRRNVSISSDFVLGQSQTLIHNSCIEQPPL